MPVGDRGGHPPVNGPAPAASPWGEPAPAISTSIRPNPSGKGRSRSGPSPSRAAAASAVTVRRGFRKRPVQLVEQTILVRLIPRTSVFGRLRAIVALAVIAVAMGLLVAGTLSAVVWGIARAIHHAATN